MDPYNPSHIAKMFTNYMNDGMDEELVMLFFESQNKEEASSSKRPRNQRRDTKRNREK